MIVGVAAACPIFPGDGESIADMLEQLMLFF
jgi:hypothetical protein